MTVTTESKSKSKSKSTSLLNSIFKEKRNKDEKSTTKNENVNESNESKNNSLSNLFNVSSNFPDRPNISISKSNTSKTPKIDKKNTQDTKKQIVKGGKKRVRDIKRQGKKSSTSVERINEEETKPAKVKDANMNDETKAKGSPNDVETKNDKNQDERTIFVGNLPLSISRKQLASIFKQCGRVDSTRLRSILPTGVKLPPERKGQQVSNEFCLLKEEAGSGKLWT